MMIVDIRKLNAKRQYFGTEQFEYLPDENLLDIPFAAFDGAVKVRFDFDLYEDDSLEIKGTVQYRLVGQCSRCLKDTALEIEGALEACFLPKKTEEDYFYQGGMVDVTEAVRDAIVASLPFSLTCGDDNCQMISYDEN